MKVRYEKQGIHFYDRISGMHVLLDEVSVPHEKIHIGPRVISLALTNGCDLNCSFCYAPKNSNTHNPNYVYNLCLAMDSLGVLEVAFGGGEPTLYPHLSELCKKVWNSTNLGISITTNGHHLTKSIINDLAGNISIIRLSIDAMEPLYSEIRGRSISDLVEKIQCLQDKIPFGINTVINERTIEYLNDVLKFARDYGAESLLLLPEVHRGSFILNKDCWLELENWINQSWQKFPLEITASAREYLDCPFLFDDDEDLELSYWHIGAEGKIRESSYYEGGTPIHGGNSLINFFMKLNTVRNSRQNETPKLL